MIQKIRIKNFKCHLDTLVKLSGGINIIHGASNGGKSAILKALNLVINNKPSGHAYITHGQKVCEVAVTVMGNDGNKYVVTRIRSKSKNEYRVKVKGETEVFKAMGNDVPETVQKIFNMSSYNMQSQFDKFFLLQSTGGEVARELNSLAGLGAIDNYYSAISSANLNATSTMKVLEEQKTTATEDLETECRNEETLELLTKKANKLKKLETNYNNKIEASERLNSILGKLARSAKRTAQIKLKIKHMAPMERLIDYSTEYSRAEKSGSKIGKWLESIYVAKEFPQIGVWNSLDKRVGKLGVVADDIDRVGTLINKIGVRKVATQVYDEKFLLPAQEKLTALEAEIEVCPLCGGDYENSES